MRKSDFSGYLTVEATIIVSIVLYACMFLIFMGLYKYDRCVMEQDIYRAALWSSSLYGANQSEKYRAAADLLAEMTEDGYLAVEERHEIRVRNSVEIVAEGSMSIPLFGETGFTGRAESKCLDPSFFIRTCHQLGIHRKDE